MISKRNNTGIYQHFPCLLKCKTAHIFKHGNVLCRQGHTFHPFIANIHNVCKTIQIMSDRYTPPPYCEPEILFLDETLLVVAKPHGLLAVPGRGEDKQECLAARIQVQHPDAMVVHRLDMATSGLMVMALNPQAHRQLSLLFQNREVCKGYIAVVDGLVQHTEGVIELPLRCDWPNRPRQMVDHVQGKPSKTLYKVIQRNPKTDTTRIELTPITGRSHQLRIHMQSLGHSILGDPLYADEVALKKSARLLLHARSLSFVHPTTKKPLCIISEPPF
jgi:tRNA pseudouridine32 synthase/23S rRNA pseudouridine746 synthase